MTETFAELFEKDVASAPIKVGDIIKATVVDIGNDNVILNAGLKSEGVIPADQFYNEEGEIEVAVGDQVDVALDAIEDGCGETRLSREKAKRAQAWTSLLEAYENNQIVTGIITGRVKGGLTVDLKEVKAFLPGSLVDVRPLRDTGHLEGKTLDFKLIKLDQKRNNVVVSRRAVLESMDSGERQEVLSSIEEGQEIKGVVKNLTDYGAFIDLGGIDGLLHITDMAWKRVKHPSEVVEVGQDLMVKVLKFDPERSRVSLGLKQLSEDPWADISRRHPENSRLFGHVTNITDYGCFVEIEPGVEGLVHVSEIDWTNRNINPAKVVQVGDEVEVMVLEIDPERRRISLGMKQCVPNPWETFVALHKKNDRIKGVIKSITDFGIFIGLDGNIDGLVHLSDISWEASGEEAVHEYKKGDEVEAVVLSVDPARERISLGIKQLSDDPFNHYAAEHDKGSIVTGEIIDADTEGLTLQLAPSIEGYVRAIDLARDRVRDARTFAKVGDKLEAKIVGVDRKNRILNLSVKAKDEQEEKDAVKEYAHDADVPVTATLGDLLKEQMDRSDEKAAKPAEKEKESKAASDEEAPKE